MRVIGKGHHAASNPPPPPPHTPKKKKKNCVYNNYNVHVFTSPSVTGFSGSSSPALSNISFCENNNIICKCMLYVLHWQYIYMYHFENKITTHSLMNLPHWLFSQSYTSPKEDKSIVTRIYINVYKPTVQLENMVRNNYLMVWQLLSGWSNQTISCACTCIYIVYVFNCVAILYHTAILFAS